MSELKFGKREWLFGSLIVVIYTTCLLVFLHNNLYISDVQFLYRRGLNILTCLKDGNPPWFFYNMMNGFGYGVSFFYGQLTLYPFLPIIAFCSYETFVVVYFGVTIFLVYSGAWMLSSRLCKYPLQVAIIVTCSFFCMQCIMSVGMHCFWFGIGLVMMFLAYAYGFFRLGNKHSIVKAGLLFFMILGTNMMSTWICFLYCVVLCLLYFDYHRIKEYCITLVGFILICAYPLCNYIYHAPGQLHTTPSSEIYGLYFANLAANMIPFNMKSAYYCLFEPTVFALMMYGWFKSKTIRGHFAFLVLFFYNVLAMHEIWKLFCLGDILVYQFPFRPVVVMLVVCVSISIRHWGKKMRFYASILSLVILPFIISVEIAPYKLDSKDTPDYFYDCINYEFLPRGVRAPVDDTDAFTFDKELCSYTLKEGGNDQVRFPKYYYHGYKAFTESGDELDCYRGQYSILTVDAKGYEGLITVKYVHPYWLRVIGLINYIIWGILFVKCFILRQTIIKEE